MTFKLHYLAPVLLISAIGAFPGCIKEIKQEQDFGDEVEATSISNALKLAAPQHPADMLVGEFVYYETSAQVEGGSPFVAAQRAITITGREDLADHILFSFVEQIGELVNGEIVTSSKEYVGRVDLPGASTSSANRDSVFSSSSILQLELNSLRSQAQILPTQIQANTKITYHNFSQRDIFWPVPRLVKERPNCGGLGADVCAKGLPAIQMTYSKVKWEGSSGNKQDFVVVLSSQTPFLAAQLMTCVEGFVSYQGQRLRLTQCEEAKDFRYGVLPNPDPEETTFGSEEIRP